MRVHNPYWSSSPSQPTFVSASNVACIYGSDYPFHMKLTRVFCIGILLSGICIAPTQASDPTPVLHNKGAISNFPVDATSGFYISAPLQGSVPRRSGVPQQYSYGASWYSSMYPISTTNVEGLEIGLNSTWITADNRDKPDSLGQEMCKVGANDHFREIVRKEGGNSGLVLFQTIEGSMGWWKPTRFPSIFPKYLPNVTQNCYATLQGTPGWGFYGEETPKNQTGVIQLSNQILMPPDGLTFKPNFSGKLLGTNWQALKLPSFDHAYNDMAGENNWTLFLNSENFKGPVAFIAPQYWSDGALINPAQAGLGLDHKPGMANLMSSEWEVVPYLSYTDSNGKVFSKIPNISLPVDENKKFILGGDFTGYSSRADTFSSAGAYKAKLESGPSPLYQAGLPIPSLKDLMSGKTFFDNQMFGLQLPETTGSSYQIGPYFQQKNGEVVPIDKSLVPNALVNTEIPTKKINTAFVYDTPKWWDLSTANSKEFTTKLSDGTIVVYRWFKFVDQPALSRFKLNEQEKKSLQEAVIKIQQTWKSNALMDGPSSGSLVEFDKGVLVTPPSGLEVGYVPIVVKQYATKSSASEADLAIFEECQNYKKNNTSIICTQPVALTPTPVASTPTPTQNSVQPSPKKLTIRCIKGRTVKKVTSITPTCPSGYRLKKA